MPRKILPPPTNVVVLPEGIHKPIEDAKPERKPIEASEPAPAAIATFCPPSPTITRFISFVDVGFHTWDVTPSPSPEPSDRFARFGGRAGRDVAGAIGRADALVIAAGSGFGSAGGSDAKAAATPIEKTAATGAYKDKTGAFKDVTDLLESEEAKMFKVLRWGGTPAKAFRGLIEVNNQNDRAWKLHVDAVDRRFNLVYTVLLTISVGCILGVQDLAGLPNPPLLFTGIPDATPVPAIS
jgi:hypothetical protein